MIRETSTSRRLARAFGTRRARDRTRRRGTRRRRRRRLERRRLERRRLERRRGTRRDANARVMRGSCTYVWVNSVRERDAVEFFCIPID